MTTETTARVSMLVDAKPEALYDAFVQPVHLCRYWLSVAAGPLQIGSPMHLTFMVPGASVDTAATVMDRGRALVWDWSDGTRVSVEFEAVDNATLVTLVNDRLPGAGAEQVAAALNATEGFAIVLSDLKTYLESGSSAGLTRAKARLIVLRA